jgi:hypothetical protein
MNGRIKLWQLATAAMIGGAATGGMAASCHEAELAPLQLREHEAHVTLQSGYARVEATQTVYNPNPGEVEAILHVPIPRGAAVAEVELIGEGESLRGEAMASDQAAALYDALEAGRGSRALAQRIENGDVEIRIPRLAARSEAGVRWVYYEPVALRRGEGRYEYPAASRVELPGRAIWAPVSELGGKFRLTFDLCFADAVTQIETPGFAGAVSVTRLDVDRQRVALEAEPGELGESTVLTYRVEEDPRGSVSLHAHRPERQAPGTFMMVFSPSSGFEVDGVGGAEAVLHFPGGRVFETTELSAGPLRRGEQRVVFGRYKESGRNRVVLNNGGPLGEVPHDMIVALPVHDAETPELERLWAQGRLDWLASLEREGVYSGEAVRESEAELGVEYQLLNRSTAFVVMSDEGFAFRGIERRNARRAGEERQAQAVRSSQPVWRARADMNDPFFAARVAAQGRCCDFEAMREARDAYGLDLGERVAIAPIAEAMRQY